MISGFWRADIDTCIYCIEALQLCARCQNKKKNMPGLRKKERKKDSVRGMEGRPWKKKTKYI